MAANPGAGSPRPSSTRVPGCDVCDRIATQVTTCHEHAADHKGIAPSVVSLFGRSLSPDNSVGCSPRQGYNSMKRRISLVVGSATLAGATAALAIGGTHAFADSEMSAQASSPAVSAQVNVVELPV